MDQNTVTILNEKFENDKTGAEPSPCLFER